MASRTYTQHFADGTKKTFLRHRQGRKPSGLSKPINVRLWQDDKNTMDLLADKMGYLWNENSFIREAVRKELLNSVYTELVNT